MHPSMINLKSSLFCKPILSSCKLLNVIAEISCQPLYSICQSSWSSFRETSRLTTFYPLVINPA